MEWIDKHLNQSQASAESALSLGALIIGHARKRCVPRGSSAKTVSDGLGAKSGRPGLILDPTNSFSGGCFQKPVCDCSQTGFDFV